MSALQQCAVVRPIPQPTITYGPFSNDFAFRFSLPSEWGLEAEDLWRVLDFQPFCIPQFPGEYTSVATGYTCGTNLTGAEAGALVGTAMVELHAVVAAISQARPLAIPADLDDLLTRATLCHGLPANIDDWARQLGEDVGALTD